MNYERISDKSTLLFAQLVTLIVLTVGVAVINLLIITVLGSKNYKRLITSYSLWTGVLLFVDVE